MQQPSINDIIKSTITLLNYRYKLIKNPIPEQLSRSTWTLSNKRGFFLGIIRYGKESHIIELHQILSDHDEFQKQQTLLSYEQLKNKNYSRTFIDRMFDFYIRPYHIGYLPTIFDADTPKDARDRSFADRLKDRDGRCLLCWLDRGLHGSHIIAYKNNGIGGNQGDAMQRARLTNIDELPNGLLLCRDCHGEFDQLARYVQVVGSESGGEAQVIDEQWQEDLTRVFLDADLNNEILVYVGGGRKKSKYEKMLLSNVDRVEKKRADATDDDSVSNLDSENDDKMQMDDVKRENLDLVIQDLHNGLLFWKEDEGNLSAVVLVLDGAQWIQNLDKEKFKKTPLIKISDDQYVVKAVNGNLHLTKLNREFIKETKEFEVLQYLTIEAENNRLLIKKVGKVEKVFRVEKVLVGGKYLLKVVDKMLVADKLLAKVVNYSVAAGDDKQDDYRLAVSDLKDHRLKRQGQRTFFRQALESNDEAALYFVKNNPDNLPNLEALELHKTACLIWRMAAAAEYVDDNYSDDEGFSDTVGELIDIDSLTPIETRSDSDKFGEAPDLYVEESARDSTKTLREEVSNLQISNEMVNCGNKRLVAPKFLKRSSPQCH